MRFRCIESLVRVTGLTLAVLQFATSSTRAQTYDWQADPNGGNPTVSITFSNANGVGSKTETGVYAEGFNVWNANTGSATSGNFTAFCIDLWHTQHSTSFTPSASFNTTAGENSTLSGLFVNPLSSSTTPASTVTNELNYLGTIATSINTGNADQVGAVQLAIWAVADGD